MDKFRLGYLNGLANGIILCSLLIPIGNLIFKKTVYWYWFVGDICLLTIGVIIYIIFWYYVMKEDLTKVEVNKNDKK